MQRHEPHAIASPDRSVTKLGITKLGIVRFVLSEESRRPSGDDRTKTIVELSSFSRQETSRSTAQLPPSAERRDRPSQIDGAFNARAPGARAPGGLAAWLLR